MLETILDMLWPDSHNTRVVLLGCCALGVAAGVVGTFLQLRKRTLLADVVSHAALPGVAGAFLLAAAFGLDGRSLAWLLPGAAATGLLGVIVVGLLDRHSRLKPDAAMASVLGVFFGAGVVLLSVIQQIPSGSRAGLDSFIFGKASSMLTRDAWTVAIVAAVIVLVCVCLFKELRLLCFDDAFASNVGLRVGLLDLILLLLATLVAVVGLQSVGLILVVAMLVIPPAAARFWTQQLRPTLAIAALVGAIASFAGVVASSLHAQLPSGPAIVLAAAICFAFSMLFGSTRGVLILGVRRHLLARRVRREHMLRRIVELRDSQTNRESLETFAFTATQLADAGLRDHAAVNAAVRRGFIRREGDSNLRLTELGIEAARRATRNHRLWELFLMRHADVAADHVDRSADAVEHVLDPKLVEELSRELEHEDEDIPPSPHPLAPGGGR